MAGPGPQPDHLPPHPWPSSMYMNKDEFMDFSVTCSHYLEDFWYSEQTLLVNLGCLELVWILLC